MLASVRAASLGFAFALFAIGCGPSAPNSNECAADLDSDPDHCGACDSPCADGELCVAGQCELDSPECTPGASEACYDGPAGTAGVAACASGSRLCQDNGRWSSCNGQVLPQPEICDNGLDENCSGVADEDVDEDGDGFSTCDGDCCDSTDSGCQSPELVNAGAFEAPGNELDDDCDGTVDNTVAANCDTGLASNSTDGLDYAYAMDLCQTTTADPGAPWGVIDATLLRADGSGAPVAEQRAIRPAFGGTTVQSGASMVTLSTGNAAATGQTAPNFTAFQGGRELAVSDGMPADWLTANGNNLPNVTGCPEPNGGTTAHDPVMLQLRVRTPTNARSFSLKTNFLSSEYPEWVCSAFNDFFVVLLDSTWSGQPANPADKNLAFYVSPTATRYPVGVNLAHGNTGLFQICKNGATGCAEGAVDGTISTCAGTAELTGTGMDPTNPAPQFSDDVGYCGANNQVGGGTGWLTTSGNVNGGEIITLRIALWDTSDGYYDSVALIDQFEWSVEASEPGTVIDVD